MAKIGSPIKHFLDLISQWNFNPPQKTQWVVRIQPDSSNFFNTIGSEQFTSLDDGGFIINNNLSTIQRKLLSERTQPQTDGLGLFFAQNITIPKEGFATTNSSIDGMNGYLKGTVGGDRFSFDQKTLKIGFLETNLDFVSGLIRPWIIAASYRGLINTGTENSIKSTINVIEYTNRNDTSAKPQRRTHTFTGCVPLDTDEMELKQDSTQELRISQVNWTFIRHTYTIYDSN